MGEKRNFAALEWVVGEISDTLKEARQSLEAYVEDSKDSTRIRFCLTHIHQVLGSLQMVEFHGAALLAEEMEQTAQAIMDHSVSSLPEAQEVLMRALLQLPIFLDHAKTEKEDNPARVMPLLNDLRAVRNQSYMSETNLFSPDLSKVGEVTGSRHPVLQNRDKLLPVLKKLREMYQYAAASVLRGIKVDENLNYIEKVFSRLDMLTTGTRCHPIWEVAAALIDALKRDEVELTVAVKGMLRHIARELRILGEKSPGAMDLPPRESLLKNLLYYVGRAEEGSEKVAQIKTKYKLNTAAGASPDNDVSAGDDMLQAPDAEAIRSVVVALQDEIETIKHCLDMSLSGQNSSEELKEVLPIAKRVADTLAVLGIGDLRKAMLAQTSALENLCQANEIDEDSLTAVAGKIIAIEQRLSAIGKSAGKHSDLSTVDEREVEIDDAKAAVIGECAAGLQNAKEAIIDFISSQWDQSHLDTATAMLGDIRGGLNMIPLPRAAAIINSCSDYIAQKLKGGEDHPSSEQLESLADAMASVEYYLERLAENLQEDAESTLDIAEDSLQKLGFKVPETAKPVVASEEANTEVSSDPSASMSSTETEKQEGSQAVPDDLASVDESNLVEESALSKDTTFELTNLADNNRGEDSLSQESFVEEPGATVSDAVANAGTTQAEAESAEEPESEIDDEIVEIFIEEAGEVLETLHEFYPQWKANDTDQDSLVVIRRAFHTLKGSGRMVEAFDIGELAWSIENMLNRVIDRTISVKPHVHHISEAVIDVIPSLVKAFEDRKPNPYKALTSQYEAWAHDIAEGKLPQELAEPLPSVNARDGVHPQAEAPAEKVENRSTAISAEEAIAEVDSEEDKVLQEIFSQESVTHLATVDNFIDEMENEAPIYAVPSDEFQRALHTLKGSAKMAQVWPIAEITEPLEHFAKELIAYQVRMNDDTLQLVRDASEYIRGGLDQIENGEAVTIDKTPQFVARTQELRDLSVGHLVLPKDHQTGTQKVDPRMLSLVMAEEMTRLLDADRHLNEWQQEGSREQEIRSLLEELEVLEEGARQANLPEMASLTDALQQAHCAALDHPEAANDAFFALMHRGHDALLDMVDAVAAGQNVQAPPLELMVHLASFVNKTRGVSSDLAEQAGGDELGPDTEASGENSATKNTVDTSEDSADKDQEIEFSIGSADDDPSYQVESESAVSFEADESADQKDSEEIEFSVGQADENDAAFLEGAESPEANAGKGEVSEEDFLDLESVEQSKPIAPDLEEPSDSPPEILETPIADSAPPIDSVAIPGLLDVLDVHSDDFDQDILEIFLEEADELVESMDEAIHTWETDWSDKESVEEIKRVLHTLKGGARLSGLLVMGDIVHDYETMIIDMGQDFSGVDEEFFRTIHAYQDKILSGVKGVKAFIDGEYERAHPQQVAEDSSTSGEAGAVSEDADLDNREAHDQSEESKDKDNVLPFEPKPAKENYPVSGDAADFVMPTATPGSGPGGAQATATQALKKAGPQEVVKVSAELLEELVNLAGETSINRSRLEQYVTDFSFALEEVDSTINRLQDQLRRLDIETEAQVLFRQEQMEASDQFDPLEMDRYSHLQQLSRSLIESASDLMDLKSDLNDKLRTTETLLVQQSRINTTLQEGLMRSRMVPFSRLVPRLRRIVRQVSNELGKSVSFELDNVEGELDRSVLERMVPPFEHMLRNAVDHGIESPEDRASAGKPETGRIVLTLSREGGDVIIRLADDGRGVNLKRVREKAIERELMSADAELSDHDIMQFILHAGFSTADSVTQISGRGVGMDVVNAEIKQLGGSVTINSSWGKGTEFVIRLPFTLSVNRALMVAIGTEQYAVPLSSIEGIVRVSPFELEHYYATPDSKFEYANENYDVRYLGNLLFSDAAPTLVGHVLPLPVLLVRSAENTMALQVDAVMGSREIVVKNLGQQFSTVNGLSGATVMGDGSVVVILDPHAIVRQEIAQANLLLEGGEQKRQETERKQDARIKHIMVVDDSVTVRKVTTRFLEREGFEVTTAKDGVDAVRILQEMVPDLMLLDIEMPRMDGFEVAKTVRTTKRWKDLPIIMITSRTGDKHREHAISLGVNNYLGKPYQEDILLEAIGEIFEPNEQ